MNQPAATSQGDVQAAFCAVLVDEWVRGGLTDAVVAPGSRSTPLVLALDADPAVRVHVVLDERSAGFTALGLALSTRRPVAIATTSGTASVELHPAVVEAYHSYVPLIAATSDRPPELHDVGAPQTVEQESLFSRAVRWAVSPGVPDLGSVATWRSLGSRIVVEATGSGGPAGPVHVNLAFREPLLGDAGSIGVPPGRTSREPWHKVTRSLTGSAPREVVDLLERYSGRRGLVVAGWGAGAGGSGLVRAAGAVGWPVFADPRSGCRAGPEPVVAAADALLRVPAIGHGWTPEIVVRAGSPWASKVLSQWLGSLPPDIPQVLVDPWGRWSDPERRSSHVVAGGAGELLAEVAAGQDGPKSSSWFSGWADAERAAQQAFDRLLGPGGDFEMSEPGVARALLAGAPAGTRVMVSSSMPVRDVEWFGPPSFDCEVLSNRGANGIDGVLSTAIGVALSGVPAIALLGDLAFLHDAGALLGLNNRDISLTVLVVDNNGGGIFSFLPQASALPAETYERYWGTPQDADLLSIAAGYGVAAQGIDSRSGLDDLIAGAGKPGVRVAIVRSDRADNVVAHERLNAAVGKAAAGLV
ncbi:MAG TPA: 2-succinyl-5-enolpyruvyl-6-hydroxy-3-cyclohexene-1-carboxylic-acid synthase [Acidimicrobiales bacterium]